MADEAAFEGWVRDVQGWADGCGADAGSLVKAAVVFGGFDPSAGCRVEVKRDGVSASLSFVLSDAVFAAPAFPQSQTTDEHAAAIDAGQAGVEAPAEEAPAGEAAAEVVAPDPLVASSDASSVPSSDSSDGVAA